jgi:predicted deacetylase
MDISIHTRHLKRVFWSWIVLPTLLMALGLATRSAFAKGQIIVAFRYDDYSAISDTKLEQSLIRDFAARGIPLTIGVIPHVASVDCHDPRPQKLLNLPKEKASLLVRAAKEGVVEIALHGYSHQTIRRKTPSLGYTEFEGLPYREQCKRIESGKRFLEESLGIRITTFIPPWNSYDLRTIRALELNNFNVLSANTNGPVENNSSLSYVPVTCDLNEVMDAVVEARKYASYNPIVGVLFHSFEIRESIHAREGAIPYSRLLNTLDWLKRQPDVRLCKISEATRLTSLNATRLAACQQMKHGWLLQLSPDFIRRRYLARYSYPDPGFTRDVAKKWLGSLSIFYLAILAFGGTVSTVLFSVRRWIGKQASWICLLIALAAVTVLSARRWDWPLSHAVVLSYTAGSAIAIAAIKLGAQLRTKRVSTVSH